MILLNTSDFILNPYSIRHSFILLLEYRLRTYSDVYNLSKIEQIVKENKIPNIQALFEVIDVDSNKNLYIPFDDIRGKVLRYIEFGGESIKPTHILKDTTRIIEDLYGGK